MSKPEKYQHINFTPPSGVRREAEYGLKLRREHGRGGTAVGIARARDLSNGVELSPSTVRRMKAFFDRHASDEKAEGFRQGEPGFPSNGKIANLLWGGPSGYSFAKKVVAQMEAADAKAEGRDLRPYGSSHGIHPRVVVVHGAPCSGKADYVWKHKGDNDVVFDFNRIMESLSGSNKSRDDLVSYCLDIRTLILKKALRGKDSPKTWIITTKVGDDLKSQLSDVPVKYVHIEAPKEECLARLETERHPDDVEELRKVIEDYFSTEQEQRFAPAAPNVERRFLGNFSQAEKADPNLLRVERRSDPQDGKPRTYIVGYAATFGRDSLLLGDFVERIEPSAFDIVAKREDGEGKPLETRCLFNHSPDHLLGRFPTTMRMTVDEKGLKYECLLPESRSDLAELIERGDLKGSSFSFVIADGGERWTVEDGRSIRVVTAIKSLLDCGPVTYPAYGDASVSVAKRSYEQFVQEKIRKPSRLPEVKAKAAAVSAEMRQFLAERRDCGRDEGGKFGSGNECQAKGKGTTKAYVSSKDMNAAKEAKDDYDAGRKPWAVGAALGATIGSAFGIPGTIGGGIVGAALGAVSSAVMSARMTSLKEEMKLTDESLGKVSGSIFGEGKKTSMAAISKSTIAIERGDSVALISSGPSGTSFYYQPGPDKDGKFDLKAVEKAAKSVNAVSVSVMSSHGSDDKLLESKGYRQSPNASKGVYEKRLRASKRSIDRIADKEDLHRVRTACEDFLAERRDCGRDEGGKFGSGNECQNDAAAATGEKSKYMEWKKGDHLKEGKPEKTQGFLDDAREGQLARGGKDGGKSDDGGGVQTWSKGDDYPWTTQQVGTDEGYLQARHPDGSKTEKYPFSKGDTSAASEALKNELKKKKKSRASDVAEETLRFLRERTRM